MVTEQDIKDYYNSHHREKGTGAWRPPAAFPYFLDLAGVSGGQRVLDIGCGTGFLLQAADARGAETHGLDISEEALKLAAEATPNSELKIGKAEALPYGDAHFHRVFCLGAMEHFLDMDKGLDEMIRVTAPGGKLCVVVPNDNYWWWLFHRQKGTHQQAINERMMSLQAWQDFFRKHGLAIETVCQDRHWFLHGTPVFSSKNPLVWLRILSRKLRWAILPLRHTYQFIFLLQKPE